MTSCECLIYIFCDSVENLCCLEVVFFLLVFADSITAAEPKSTSTAAMKPKICSSCVFYFSLRFVDAFGYTHRIIGDYFSSPVQDRKGRVNCQISAFCSLLLTLLFSTEPQRATTRVSLDNFRSIDRSVQSLQKRGRTKRSRKFVERRVSSGFNR